MSDATTAATASQRPRSQLRSVAMPSEHGGWGLTIEPGLLGLLVEPSVAGACLATGAVVLFVLRTPLELALIDRRRHRRLPRTPIAERVAVIEAVVLGGLVALAIATADGGRWWIPLAVAAPLAAVELGYDIRSRRRRLIPELTGAVAIASVASAVAIAGGAQGRLAVGLWVVLAARAVTSIPHVRAQIVRSRGRSPQPRLTATTDGFAIALAVSALVLDERLALGAIVVAAIVGLQIIRRRRPVAPVKIIGAIQMVLGLAVVAATAVGVWVL